MSKTSEHPLKYKNVSGETIPAYGLIKLESGTRQSSNELNPHGDLVEATGEEALYVNSGLEVEDDDYGNCRSCNLGRFWVRYNPGDAPNDGEVVGPVDGETYVDTTGDGFVVIFKDTAKGLVLCDRPGGAGRLTSIFGFNGAAWTTCEYDPVTGTIVGTLYRGISRTQQYSFDVDVMMTTDGKLFANGSANVNANNGIGALYDPDTGDTLWLSDNNGSTAVTDLFSVYSGGTADRRGARHVLESGDNALWIAGTGSVARMSAATGAFSVRVATFGGVITNLFPCPTSGSVIIRPGESASSDRISILNSAGSRTHGYSAITPLDVSQGGTVVAVVNSTALVILDAADLSVTTSNGLGASHVSVATDGTTAWVLCDEATDKIRAYDVTNVAAELWNANAAASANSFIVYNPGNGYLYNYSGVTIRKVSASDGSVVWTSANLGSSVNSHRNWVGFGSDFVVIGVRTNSAANVFCLEDSDGSIRWSDYNGKAFDLAGSAWNMGSHGVCVSPSDRIFVSHGHKNQ